MSNGTFTVKRDELIVVMERTFDAPRDVVFRAFIDPRAIPKWWGPRHLTTTVDVMDMRQGGAWRFVCRDSRLIARFLLLPFRKRINVNFPTRPGNF